MKVYFILTKMSSRSGVVFSPTQASQGLVGRTDFNSGVLETSEKLECVGGGGGRARGGCKERVHPTRRPPFP